MARWRCRADIAASGFKPKNFWLWDGVELTPQATIYIQEVCQRLQNEMLTFDKGGIERVGYYDGTIAGLVACYQTDKDSPYRKLQPRSRESYDHYCKRLEKDITEPLKDLRGRSFLRLHNQWSAGGKLTMAHHLITMMRILVGFGATYLEEPDCERLAGILHNMKFKGSKPREAHLSGEQVVKIRERAHAAGWPSIALGQAFQFECLLRQKDVVGEWIGLNEPALSHVISGGMKWVKGMRWEEIDQNLVLHHLTSKRQKMLDVPLSKAPMVLQEFDRQFPHFKTQGRAALPASGPIIVSERTRIPWTDDEYRRQWRIIATACGVPKGVRNMDSRAGGITEATEAGAELEHVKHAATHGDIAMTQRYSRGAADKIAKVMDLRAAYRNKPGNKD
jgi:hypothetical protein